MDQEKNLENSKKRLKVYYSLLVSVLCFIGVSFALFTLFLRQSDNNAVTALSCFSTTLTEENSAITLTDEYPIPDADGIKKTPFTFKLTNNCNNSVKAYITLDPLKEGSSNYILSKYMKANVSTKGSTDGTSLIIGNQDTKVLENKDNGFIVKEIDLASKESKEFDLRIWIDYDTTKEQASGMTYLSQVVIVTEPGKPTFAGTILANNTVQTPLTTPGREVSAYTLDDITYTQSASVSSTYQAYYFTYGTGWEANGTNFNLTGAAVTSDTYANSYSSLVGKYLVSEDAYSNGSSTAGTMITTTNLSSVYYVVSATSSSFTYKRLGSNKNTTEALLASTKDDYGTSYYFRGAVKNNYVQFANKCWRIVRIVGNGSVKLVLHNDNTSGISNPCSSANNKAYAAFAHYDENTYWSTFNSNYVDNAYIGFMYGQAGASDYASTHANTNKSIILTYLEEWYKNNLVSYEDKLADIIWCNDKSTFTTFTSGSTYGTGLGHGTNPTGYGAYNRIYGGNAVSYASPSLICPNDNNGGKLSKFTVDDTTNGNGNLKYKVGLLTADEIAYAGYATGIGTGLYNTGNYLQENATGSYWWSLSPHYFDGNFAGVWHVNSRNGYFAYNRVHNNDGVRPSISLISSTIISGGTGTAEDPYIVNS